MLIHHNDSEKSNISKRIERDLTIIDNVCLTNDVMKEKSNNNAVVHRNLCHKNSTEKYFQKNYPIYANISSCPIGNKNRSEFYIPNINTCGRLISNGLARKNSEQGREDSAAGVDLPDPIESFTDAVKRECSALGRDSKTLWRRSALLWGESIVDAHRHSLTGTSDNASTTEGDEDSRTWDTNTYTTEEEDQSCDIEYKRSSLDANVRRVVIRDGSPVISTVVMDVEESEDDSVSTSDEHKIEVMDTASFLEKTSKYETSILGYLCSPTSVIRENGTEETVTIDFEFWVSIKNDCLGSY